MSKWKNRIVKRVMAVILSGAMVMSGMISSGISAFAVESADIEVTEDMTSWDETKAVSEEEAEDEEVKQNDSEETEIEEQESKKAETEPGTASGNESMAAKEDANQEVEETKESEINTENVEESQTDAVDNKAAGDDEDPVIEFSLRADEIEESSLTSDYPKNGFTIKVKSGTTIKVDGSNKGGYTKCIKLGGEGKADNRSIHFTAEDAGKLTVYAVSSSSTDPKILTLYQYNGSQSTKVSSRDIATGSALQELSYEITEPGDYYVGGDGGVNVYCIKFSNKKEEDIYDPWEVDAEPTTFVAPEGDIVYGENEGVDNTKTKYNLEGYAASANVTGGGLLKEESPCYHKVTNELEFIQTLSDLFRVKDKPHVIEITTDLNLGNLELNEKYPDDKLNVTTGGDGYSNLIRAQGAYPLMHPTLKETGVSYIKLHDFHNLTIFSKNGASIKHAELNIEGSSSNIIIRNLTFDELWEWDEGVWDADKNKWDCKPGDYDRNDWDYISVDDNAEGVWIDHCTFYKAYDGIIDVKNPGSKDMKLDYERVTISWCEILPGSKDNTFFDAQMAWLENNINNEDVDIAYYRQLRNDENMSAKDVWWSSYGQKKVHLFGAGDGDTQDKAIRVTLANNYYENTMSRLPRLRFGKVHEYNCVFDAQELHDQHKNGNPHITGNGAISTCKGEMLIENCYISGVRTPLRSGYGGVSGYIKAVDTLYYMNGERQNLEIKAEGTDGLKVTDEVRFRERLPYQNYTKYDASTLNSVVVPYAGAGKLTMTTVQWERTSYNGEEGGGDDEGSTGTIPDESETDPSGSESNPSESESNPSEPESNPSESESNPSEPGTDPSEPESDSSEPESNSSEPESNPSESESSPESNEADIQIVGLEKSYQYTGDKIIPAFDVIDYDIPGGKLLALGVDYTVTYKNNKEISADGKKAEIIVKGKGNYAAVKGSEAKATFTIVDADDAGETPLADIKGAKISKIDGVDDAYYNGTPHIPGTITLTLKDKTTTVSYTYNADTGKYEKADKTPMDVNIAVSNNINKGTASVLVSGVDDKGKPVKIKGKFKIKPIDLSQKTVAITPGKAVYSPMGATPETLTVTCDGRELKQGRDYTVKYAKNKAAGTATITVTGKGNYTKKAAAKEYTVTAADMSDFKVATVTANEGTKAGKIKATVVDQKGSALKAKQYTLEIYPVTVDGDTKTVGTTAHEASYVLNAGDVIHVVARANDSTNLTAGTTEADFTVGKDISKAKFTLTPEAKKGIAYTGSEIKLEEKHFASATYKDGTELHMNGEYEIVSYANNVNKGTATAVIKGINGYSGTKTIKFKITQKGITNIKLQEALEQILEQLSKK